MKALICHIDHNDHNGNARWFSIADSAILFSPRPYFLPDWLAEPHLNAALAIRLSRLGKNIENRFASRYYDAVAAAMLPSQNTTLPSGNALRDNADGALILGKMLPLPENELHITASRGNITWLNTTLHHWRYNADNAIAQASKTITWKTGDLLLLALPQTTPIKINDNIKADINRQSSLSTNIK